MAPLRDALNRFDPQLVVKLTTGGVHRREDDQRQELGMTLMLVFGAMALALAACRYLRRHRLRRGAAPNRAGDAHRAWCAIGLCVANAAGYRAEAGDRRRVDRPR